MGVALTGPESRPPLVFDTREIKRGSLLEVDRLVPAPADLGVALATFPEGSDLTLNLTFEFVVDGIIVRGTVEGTVHAECARCLDPVTWREQVELTELFLFPPQREGEELSEDDLVLEGDLLDLEPTVRDAVVLQLPLAPVCREDCPGLCSACGARLAEDPEHSHDEVDPRWAALTALIEDEQD